MKEKEIHHYTESVFYSMEQVVVYLRVKGSQFFNQLNTDITLDQFVALDAIYTNNDICQRDLSKLILKDRSNTGRILNILEEKGFIQRALETKGKRPVKKIYITPKGKNTIEKNHPKLREAFCQVFEGISEDEFIKLRTFLDTLKSKLSKITSIQI